MAKQEHELERVAASIADDAPVDWRELDPAAQRDAAGLREIEQLVQGFRRVHLAGGERRHLQQRVAFRFGGLEVLECIGAGAQGEVWRAYDPLLDQQVALKLRKLDSGALAHQFLDEGRRLARVRQANILSVYGAAVHAGRAGLWTELIRGTALAELLTQHGPFPADEVCSIGHELCHALAAVHRHGLVHGDIKAENVMRDHGGRIVLMDFGAAREFAVADAAVVSGTLHYLAPEVLRGAASTPASDQYALGVLLFHLLTAAYPYAAKDVSALLGAQERGERSTLATLRPGLPKALLRAIERALKTDPSHRHASALAFATALAPARAPAPDWRAVAVVAACAGMVALGLGFGLSRWRAAPAPAWQANAAFYRVDGHGSSALNDGAVIALGDRLALKFQSNRAAYVYIFDDDGSAQAAVLFPLPGIEPGNPLAADTAYRLPGKSDATVLTWQVSSQAAREEFVVLAADQAQPELERIIAAWQRASLPVGSARGALALTPAPSEAEITSASLRAVLSKLQGDEVHLRRWRFVFPHTSG